ncbi:hypothetical protein AABB24_017458, partial [Solanum stoloniferum]
PKDPANNTYSSTKTTPLPCAPPSSREQRISRKSQQIRREICVNKQIRHTSRVPFFHNFRFPIPSIVDLKEQAKILNFKKKIQSVFPLKSALSFIYLRSFSRLLKKEKRGERKKKKRQKKAS